jgi:pyrroline-5-carboxylate reductase
VSFPPVVFLGAGQMAEALIRGVLRAGLLSPGEIMATDVRASRLETLGAELGIRTDADNGAAIGFGRLVLVAVKPQDVAGLMAEVGSKLTPEHVVVSIAAGVTISQIEQAIETSGIGPRPTVRVVRVMPNTPALVGAGMAAVALGRYANPDDGELVRELMSAVGQAVMLPEYQLDAVTALSASGPAFVAIFVEGLIDAGVRVGLTRDIATTLAVQTVLGTAQMMQSVGHHPAVIKDMVTSPAGTTIVGVHALEVGGLRGTVMNAIVAAYERSRQLGQS